MDMERRQRIRYRIGNDNDNDQWWRREDVASLAAAQNKKKKRRDAEEKEIRTEKEMTRRRWPLISLKVRDAHPH